MVTWRIYHYTYKDVCDDSWYGKKTDDRTIGYVTDTEENVIALVEKLNKKNHSYYASKDPSDEFDEDYADEDYISYEPLHINTIEGLERWYMV